MDLYFNKGSEIFKKFTFRYMNLGILFSKYSNAKLKKVLLDFYGEEIFDNCKTRVCIPAIDITNGKPMVFKTKHHRDYINDYLLKVWEIGCATSAAPIFFPSFKNIKKNYYIDGGLYANNPVLVGIAEAIKLGYGLNEIYVLSLGTCSRIFHLEKLTNLMGGLIPWNTSLIEISFQAQSKSACSIASYLIGEKNFFRIDQFLPDNRFLWFFPKFGLDILRSKDTLRNFAEYKAKETFITLKDVFFESKVNLYK